MAHFFKATCLPHVFVVVVFLSPLVLRFPPFLGEILSVLLLCLYSLKGGTQLLVGDSEGRRHVQLLFLSIFDTTLIGAVSSIFCKDFVNFSSECLSEN